VLDDALLGDVTAEQIERILKPKVDAAYHLHEITSKLDIAEFVLFSSSAGILGNAAQSVYAGANAALDALATRRGALGLPGKSLAWGSWAQVGRVVEMDEVLQRRLQRAGIVPIDVETAMRLLDQARACPESVLALLKIDHAVLRRAAVEQPEVVPALLHKLITDRRVGEKDKTIVVNTLSDRLVNVPVEAWHETLVNAVRGELAAVLGLSGASAVPADRPFKELGLDSLMAVEASNRLTAATGKKLPASLLFNYPTATAIASYLHDCLDPPEKNTDELKKAIEVLERFGSSALEQHGYSERLLSMAADLSPNTFTSEVKAFVDQTSDADLLKLIDEQLSATET